MPRLIPLIVLPERPVNSTIVLRRDGTPFEAGRPDTLHFTCGGCARVLAKAADTERISGLVLVCPACEALNSTAEPRAAPADGKHDPPPSWSPILATGHARIDEQHVQIFARVDALQRAMLRGDGAETASLLDFLGGYVIDHFSLEEDLMRSAQYPGFEAHLEQHSQFIRDYLGLKASITATGPTSALTIKVRAWLTEWLRWHIMGADLALARFLRNAR